MRKGRNLSGNSRNPPITSPSTTDTAAAPPAAPTRPLTMGDYAVESESIEASAPTRLFRRDEHLKFSSDNGTDDANTTEACTPAGGGGESGDDSVGSGGAVSGADKFDTEHPRVSDATVEFSGAAYRDDGRRSSARSGGSTDSSSLHRSEPISPSGIRAILKGFSLLPWQLRRFDTSISVDEQERNEATDGVVERGGISFPSVAAAAVANAVVSGAATAGDHDSKNVNDNGDDSSESIPPATTAADRGKSTGDITNHVSARGDGDGHGDDGDGDGNSSRSSSVAAILSGSSRGLNNNGAASSSSSAAAAAAAVAAETVETATEASGSRPTDGDTSGVRVEVDPLPFTPPLTQKGLSRVSRWGVRATGLCSPRIGRSHSMTAVSDMEEGARPLPSNLRWVDGSHGGSRVRGRGSDWAGVGARGRWSTPSALFGRGRSASFDNASILESDTRGRRWSTSTPWRGRNFSMGTRGREQVRGDGSGEGT